MKPKTSNGVDGMKPKTSNGVDGISKMLLKVLIIYYMNH